jgi:hypothetical protein
MSIELQAAAGLPTGLFAGLALGLPRALLVIAVGTLAISLAGSLGVDGPPTIGALLGRLGTAFAAYPIFFNAMGVAKAFGCILALRR